MDLNISQDELANARTPQALDELLAKAEAAANTDQAQGAAATGEAAAAAGATPGTTTTTSEAEAEPTGILTKSGKGVLPYSALTEARETARRIREERDAERFLRDQERAKREELERDLEALRAKAPPPAPTPAAVSQEELDRIARETAGDFAEVATLAKHAQGQNDRIAELERRLAAPAPAPVAAPAPNEADVMAEIDEAMAGAPLLMDLRGRGGRAWAAAVQIDNELRAQQPGLPMADRFLLVQQQLHRDFGMAIPDAPPVPAPVQPPATAPAPVPQATRVLPNTLSDVEGSAATNPDAAVDNMSGADLARKMLSMTPAEVAAFTRRYG